VNAKDKKKPKVSQDLPIHCFPNLWHSSIVSL